MTSSGVMDMFQPVRAARIEIAVCDGITGIGNTDNHQRDGECCQYGNDGDDRFLRQLLSPKNARSEPLTDYMTSGIRQGFLIVVPDAFPTAHWQCWALEFRHARSPGPGS